MFWLSFHLWQALCPWASRTAPFHAGSLPHCGSLYLEVEECFYPVTFLQLQWVFTSALRVTIFVAPPVKAFVPERGKRIREALRSLNLFCVYPVEFLRELSVDSPSSFTTYRLNHLSPVPSYPPSTCQFL